MADNFEAAMKAALEGPEKKKLRIFDHEFNIKPVEVSWQGNQVTAVGKISHRLSLRPDDQVYYRIIKEGDIIKDITVQIARGSGTVIFAPLLSGVAALKGVPLPPKDVETVGRNLGNMAEEQWEKVAQFLIGNIALRIDADRRTATTAAPGTARTPQTKVAAQAAQPITKVTAKKGKRA